MTAVSPFQYVGTCARLPGAVVPAIEFGILRDRHPRVGVEDVGADEQVVDADPFQFLDDTAGGVELPPGGFRVAMQVPSQFDQVVAA